MLLLSTWPSLLYPASYGMFGDAIASLVQRESPNTLDPTDDTERFSGSYWWMIMFLLNLTLESGWMRATKP